jgi:N-acetylglucosaminyl-diphospho-decaprenol L-rhamnosyltransferase
MSCVPSEVDIVVVTHNSARDIGGLLDSIPAAIGNITANVIVVDNGSTDGTVQILLDRDDCQLVQSANIGYAGGINRGVRDGSGANAILILNPDARLSPGSVAPLLDALRSPGIGIVAPRVLSDHGSLEFSLRREPSLLRALGLGWTKHPALSEYVQEAAAYKHPHAADWAVGAILMISRHCFDTLGGWDESFFLYSEETDFALRARDVGLRTWYEPRAVATHIGGGSGRSSQTHAMRAVNRVRLYRRRHGAPVSWCFYWLTVASELWWGLRGYPHARYAALVLLRPSLRPRELNCSACLMPRLAPLPGGRGAGGGVVGVRG